MSGDEFYHPEWRDDIDEAAINPDDVLASEKAESRKREKELRYKRSRLSSMRAMMADKKARKGGKS